jgi:RNA-directed DNA polymerase
VNTAREQNSTPTPQPVPEKTTHCGETRKWQWGTLTLSLNSLLVWTEPMLAALERGNDGRQWHTLNDKIWSPKNLRLALGTVTARKGAPGIDGQTTEAVEKRAEEELALIQRLLQEGRYEPQAVRRVRIDKPGSKEKRPLGIPTVRDRIVQSAMLHILEPIFERDFSESSYGFRPGRKAGQAVAVVEESLAEGYAWVVDADIKGYFDSIPQQALLARVRKKVADGKVLGLLEKFLRQGVMESGKGWEPTESGTPQGAVISPLLANIYLDDFDHEMEQQGKKMVRYADDFILLCRSQAEAQEALAQVRCWMEKAGLQLHPEKTRIVNTGAGEGFEFLGWHFERGHKWPRKKSQQKFKEAIRKRTKRSDGRSLLRIIIDVNRVVRGWGGYFQGGARSVGPKLDSWVRMRLRSILRKRDKRKGRGHGRDHNRYPNVWFAAQGLISLLQITHGAAISPAK